MNSTKRKKNALNREKQTKLRSWTNSWCQHFACYWPPHVKSFHNDTCCTLFSFTLKCNLFHLLVCCKIFSFTLFACTYEVEVFACNIMVEPSREVMPCFLHQWVKHSLVEKVNLLSTCILVSAMILKSLHVHIIFKSSSEVLLWVFFFFFASMS